MCKKVEDKYPSLNKIVLNDLKLTLDKHSAYQDGLSLVDVTEIKNDGKVYTFDTHPFYRKLRDYNAIELPDISKLNIY